MRVDPFSSKDRNRQTLQVAANGVGIASKAFAPGSIKVKAGTTVKWINGDDIEHNVVANDSSFSSDLFIAGKSYSLTFTKPGKYDFACSIHLEQMSNVSVEVTE